MSLLANAAARHDLHQYDDGTTHHGMTLSDVARALADSADLPPLVPASVTDVIDDTAALLSQHSAQLRRAEPEDLDTLARFLILKALSKTVEDEIKAIYPAVLDMVMDEDNDAAEWGPFSLTTYTRARYEYSDHVQELTDQLKATKKYEEVHKIAQCTAQRAVLHVKVST